MCLRGLQTYIKWTQRTIETTCGLHKVIFHMVFEPTTLNEVENGVVTYYLLLR